MNGMPVACQSRAVTEPQRDSGTKCRRGLQSEDQSRGKKEEQTKTTCHCETGAHTGRGNPHSLMLLSLRKADSHVATLLGMTEVFCTLPSLFHNGNRTRLATPQSALWPPTPLKGAPRWCTTNITAWDGLCAVPPPHPPRKNHPRRRSV